jgi:hypothetical protein
MISLLNLQKSTKKSNNKKNQKINQMTELLKDGTLFDKMLKYEDAKKKMNTENKFINDEFEEIMSMYSSKN